MEPALDERLAPLLGSEADEDRRRPVCLSLQRGPLERQGVDLALYGLNFAGLLVSMILNDSVCLSCLYPFALAAWMFYVQVMLGALLGLASHETQVGWSVAAPGETAAV